LLNLIAALPQPLLNKNSSELSLPLFATAIRYRYSLPLFATAPLLHFKKILVLFSDVGSILKNLTLNFFLKNVVKEKT